MLSNDSGDNTATDNDLTTMLECYRISKRARGEIYEPQKDLPDSGEGCLAIIVVIAVILTIILFIYIELY
jgi:hypothetical protein